MLEMTHSFLPHGVAPFGLIGFQKAAGQSNTQSKRSKPTPPLLINIRPRASWDYCWWHAPCGGYSFVWSFRRSKILARWLPVLPKEFLQFMSNGLYSTGICFLFYFLLLLEDLNRIVTTHEPCTVAAATPFRQRRSDAIRIVGYY